MAENSRVRRAVAGILLIALCINFIALVFLGVFGLNTSISEIIAASAVNSPITFTSNILIAVIALTIVVAIISTLVGVKARKSGPKRLGGILFMVTGSLAILFVITMFVMYGVSFHLAASDPTSALILAESSALITTALPVFLEVGIISLITGRIFEHNARLAKRAMMPALEAEDDEEEIDIEIPALAE